jgi:hypothetical protein
VKLKKNGSKRGERLSEILLTEQGVLTLNVQKSTGSLFKYMKIRDSSYNRWSHHSKYIYVSLHMHYFIAWLKMHAPKNIQGVNVLKYQAPENIKHGQSH